MHMYANIIYVCMYVCINKKIILILILIYIYVWKYFEYTFMNGHKYNVCLYISHTYFDNLFYCVYNMFLLQVNTTKLLVFDSSHYQYRHKYRRVIIYSFVSQANISIYLSIHINLFRYQH